MEALANETWWIFAGACIVVVAGLSVVDFHVPKPVLRAWLALAQGGALLAVLAAGWSWEAVDPGGGLMPTPSPATPFPPEFPPTSRSRFNSSFSCCHFPSEKKPRATDLRE